MKGGENMLYNVTIQGTTEILLHKYTAASVSEPKTRKTTKDSLNYADEWIRGTYLNEKEQVVMPWTNLFACMFDGSKGYKKGKTAFTRIIYTSLILTTAEPLITIDGRPITIDMIRNNGWLSSVGAVIAGRRIDRIRTCLPAGWMIQFSIGTRPNNILSEEDIRTIIESAGITAGLGDWRPSAPKKPGPYGQFRLFAFKEVK